MSASSVSESRFDEASWSCWIRFIAVSSLLLDAPTTERALITVSWATSIAWRSALPSAAVLPEFRSVTMSRSVFKRPEVSSPKVVWPTVFRSIWTPGPISRFTVSVFPENASLAPSW